MCSLKIFGFRYLRISLHSKFQIYRQTRLVIICLETYGKMFITTSMDYIIEVYLNITDTVLTEKKLGGKKAVPQSHALHASIVFKCSEVHALLGSV